MTEEKPAREWWIIPDRYNEGFAYEHPVADDKVKTIHVIEYSAMIEERERAERLAFKCLELRGAYEKLERELAEAKSGKFNFCGYCGYQTDAGDEGWNKLQRHISGCEKHPVYQLDVANTRLRRELAEAREENEQLMNVEYWPERCRDAEKERDRLKQELSQTKDAWESACQMAAFENDMKKMSQRHEEQVIAKLETAREALEFYGDRRNVAGNEVSPVLIYEKPAGHIARKALEEIGE